MMLSEKIAVILALFVFSTTVGMSVFVKQSEIEERLFCKDVD